MNSPTVPQTRAGSGPPPWFDAPAPLLPEILALHGRWLGDKPALIGVDETISWATLSRRLEQVANGLIADGLQPGQRVAVLMSNSVAMVEILFGVIRAGGVVVPLNTLVSADALAAMIADAEAVALFVGDDHAHRLQALTSACPGLRIHRQHRFAAWRDAQPVTPVALALADDAECNIIYSSGTTGLPKGIVHTHRRRLDWFYDLGLALRYDCGAVTLCSLGLYSNISWAAMGCTLLTGGTLVVLPGFDATGFLEAVETQRATHSAVVPVQFERMLALPDFDRHDLSSLRAIMCCGSPLAEATKRAVFRRFGCALIELYGLTEGLITTLSPEDAEQHMRSVGRPLPGTDLKILDEHDHELPPGQPGEIVGRGRIVMAGYNNRDDANAEATWTDQHGRRWLRTGDIGIIDEQGFLTLVDRKKDLIISGGQNIYPADLEAVLVQHPAVAEAAVIGIPCPTWGETPLGIVVPAAGADAQALLTWANGQLGKQQRLRGVVFVEALPRNANGKVLKRELRDRYRDYLKETA